MVPILILSGRRFDPARIPALDWLLAFLGAALAYLLWPGVPAE